jgi:hypothetical protein
VGIGNGRITCYRFVRFGQGIGGREGYRDMLASRLIRETYYDSASHASSDCYSTDDPEERGIPVCGQW